jgi:hypothetical protein
LSKRFPWRFEGFHETLVDSKVEITQEVLGLKVEFQGGRKRWAIQQHFLQQEAT